MVTSIKNDLSLKRFLIRERERERERESLKVNLEISMTVCVTLMNFN